MGEVWLARQFLASGVSRAVALKRLPRRLARKERYRRILLGEARLAMMLRHSNIIDVFDAGELAGEAYIAMEFVDGEDLSRVLKRLRALDQTELDPRLVAHIIAEILRALCYAHEFVDESGRPQCIVHRDVSPHNVMLSLAGEVKLADFGVARLASEETSGTHVKGKIRYMPPEQLRGESKRPTVDLFAVGAVLHELLDGAVFRGEDIEDATLLGLVMDGVVPELTDPSNVPPHIETLRRRLLHTNPSKRFASAREALEFIYAWDRFRNAEAGVTDLVKRVRATPTNWEPEPAADLDEQSAVRPLTDTLDPVGDTGVGFGVAETLLHDDDGKPYHSGSFEDLAVIDPLAAIDPLAEPRVDDDQLMAQLEGLSTTPKTKAKIDDFPAPPPEAPPKGRVKRRAPSEPVARGGGEGPSWTSTRTRDPDDPLPLTAHPEFDLGPALSVAPVPPASRPSTGSHAPVPRPPRRWPKRLLGLVLVAGLGVGGYFAADHYGVLDGLLAGELELIPKPPPERRRARVLHDGRPALVGFGRIDPAPLEETGIAYDFSLSHGLAQPLDALDNGQAEFVLTTLDAFLATRPKGKVVALVQVSTGAEGLVLDTEEFAKLTSLDALRSLDEGSTLAMPRSGPAASLGNAAWSYFPALTTLTPDASYDDSGAAWEALSAKANGVVGAVLSEPELSKARAAGMRVVLSSRDLPRAVVDVLVASERVLAEDPELVTKVVDAYAEVATTLTDDAALSQAIAEQRGGDQNDQELAALVAGTCLVDAAGSTVLASAIAETWAGLRLDGKQSDALPALDALTHGLELGELGGATLPASVQRCLDRELPEDRRPSGDLGTMRLPPAPSTWFEAESEALRPDAPVAVLAGLIRQLDDAGVKIQLTAYGEAKGSKAKKLGQRRAETLAKAIGVYGVEATGAAKSSDGAQLELRLSR
ncbi:serine/threonine kinase family protein [Plesiocystis pacifica SIR-1]|uniref:Serine/threonine kinase family protein n=2 Tax=Plesiocystis pacifica TaxID=191768 RepID=A6FYI7_9BACT|nr:serine/threonine kinase family protein [Plesiocystis pacifica SIR-1]